MDIKWIIASLAALASVILLFAVQKTIEVEDTLIFASGGSNQISVVNPKSGRIQSIEAGPVIHGIGALPDGSKAYASSLGADEISVIDLKAKKVSGTVDIKGTSHHISVSPDGRWVYITMGSSASVAVVDTKTDLLVQTIPVGEGPTFAEFSADGTKAYVTSMKANLVSIIDTAEMVVLKEIAVESPDHTALSVDGMELYVTSRDANQLSIIDTTNEEVKTVVPVGKGPHGVAAVDRDGRTLIFVGNRGETTLSIVDAATQQVVNTVDLETKSEHITKSADGRFLFIGSVPDKNLLIFDVAKERVVKRINVKGEIHQVETVGKALADVFDIVAVSEGYYRNIEAEQLWEALNLKDFTLINVHTPYEGELPETDLFMVYNLIAHHLDQLPETKSSPIVVYCRSGSMSAQAAETLANAGYTNVWNLKQGMQEWQQEGYPLLNLQ